MYFNHYRTLFFSTTGTEKGTHSKVLKVLTGTHFFSQSGYDCPKQLGQKGMCKSRPNRPSPILFHLSKQLTFLCTL